MGEMGRKGASMISTASCYGFIYTIFALGAMIARAWGKKPVGAQAALHLSQYYMEIVKCGIMKSALLLRY